MALGRGSGLLKVRGLGLRVRLVLGFQKVRLGVYGRSRVLRFRALKFGWLGLGRFGGLPSTLNPKP